MGGLDKDRVRKKARRQSGLITEATVLEEQHQQEIEAAQRQAEAAAPSGPAPTLAPTLKEAGGRGKTQWYLPHDLLDEIRDAIDFFKMRGLKINNRSPNAGLLVEPAIRALMASLREEHNEGRAFPECPSTTAARAKRHRQR